MPEPELSFLFIRPLNQLGVRYLVSGSVAAILYGEPRLTNDVDIVLHLRAEDITRLGTAFPSPQFYLPPLETIVAEVARERRGHFNVIDTDTGFKADFYPAGRDEFHAWAFRHARRLEYHGEPVMVAPPEYVIVRKLEYFREGGSEKHLRDIRGIWSISREEIDQAALHGWIERQGVAEEWRCALGAES
jgi:hypothetical protein